MLRVNLLLGPKTSIDIMESFERPQKRIQNYRNLTTNIFRKI